MPYHGSLDNTEDVIDSRDVIARIEWLETEIELLKEGPHEVGEYKQTEVEQACELLELESELASLKKLASQCESYGDWSHGEALIRYDHFTEYCKELASDLGYIRNDTAWPYTCIDWEQAARELQQDYTSVDFAGVTYYMRS